MLQYIQNIFKKRRARKIYTKLIISILLSILLVNFSAGQDTGQSITVTYPKGGEFFYAGEMYEIKWTTTASSGKVDLFFSIDGGHSFLSIKSCLDNTGSHQWWTPPMIDYNHALVSSMVKLKAIWKSDCTDNAITYSTYVSDSIFSIGQAKGTLTIVSNIEGYTIYLNGYKSVKNDEKGITTISLVPGNYNIVLQKDGCENATGSAEVSSHLPNTQVKIDMTCQTPTPPPTTPPTQPPTTSPPTTPPTTTPTTTQPGTGFGFLTLLFLVMAIVFIIRRK